MLPVTQSSKKAVSDFDKLQASYKVLVASVYAIIFIALYRQI